jgi:hypothetical protein
MSIPMLSSRAAVADSDIRNLFIGNHGQADSEPASNSLQLIGRSLVQ